jgi:hypothetical protein
MNYWFDRATGRIHYAMVVLIDVEKPSTPAMVLTIPHLQANNRFTEVPIGSEDYARAVDIRPI